jgi:hypothetical protein
MLGPVTPDAKGISAIAPVFMWFDQALKLQFFENVYPWSQLALQ